MGRTCARPERALGAVLAEAEHQVVRRRRHRPMCPFHHHREPAEHLPLGHAFPRRRGRHGCARREVRRRPNQFGRVVGRPSCGKSPTSPAKPVMLARVSSPSTDSTMTPYAPNRAVVVSPGRRPEPAARGAGRDETDPARARPPRAPCGKKEPIAAAPTMRRRPPAASSSPRRRARRATIPVDVHRLPGCQEPAHDLRLGLRRRRPVLAREPPTGSLARARPLARARCRAGVHRGDAAPEEIGRLPAPTSPARLGGQGRRAAAEAEAASRSQRRARATPAPLPYLVLVRSRSGYGWIRVARNLRVERRSSSSGAVAAALERPGKQTFVAMR